MLSRSGAFLLRPLRRGVGFSRVAIELVPILDPDGEMSGVKVGSDVDGVASEGGSPSVDC